MQEVFETALQDFQIAENELGYEKCLTGKVAFNERIWFQVTVDYLNLSLPIKKPFFKPITIVIPELPKGVSVIDYQSERYLTLDRSGVCDEVVVTYLSRYFNSLYGEELTFTYCIESI